MTASVAYLTNMRIQRPSLPETPLALEHGYTEALETVQAWGTARFIAFAEDAKLKLQEKMPISHLERVCHTCRASLLEVVKLREDADDAVYVKDTHRQKQECPTEFAEGATDYTKSLPVYSWNHVTKSFDITTLSDWMDTEGHLRRSMWLVGEAGAGKSRLRHMVGVEMMVAYNKDLYVFVKALDQLGILSHCGVVRKAAAVLVTDFDMKARKGPLSMEEKKGLVDVLEGASITSTDTALQSSRHSCLACFR